MKRFTYLILASLFIYDVSAQQINNLPIEEIKAKYLILDYVSASIFSSSYVLVDYGQVPPNTYLNKRKDLAGIKKNNELIEFNSEIDAINFLADYGYKLIDIEYKYISPDDSSRKYLLKKIEDYKKSNSN